MGFLSVFKNTVLLSVLILSSCGNQRSTARPGSETALVVEPVIDHLPSDSLVIASNRTEMYLPLLSSKKVAVVANQTSVIFTKMGTVHLVDSLTSLQVDIQKVFAPEHGFRGEADAGETVKDGVDNKTKLPLISLYGKNKKPTDKQLEDVELVLFDIQDVGVRFYTYIATLQLVMEACAKNNIPIIVLDRPNPNAHYIDGPTMEMEHSSFLGMAPIPLVYGMTIGEYAQMLNGEGWLEGGRKAALTIIPLENFTHQTPYKIPIRPSPNLPNDKSINLYPSLGLFEGTYINAGRGTEFQFQRYGASFLDSTAYNFSYVPEPNFGSSDPKEKGKYCYGRDLSDVPKLDEVSLSWLLDAYTNCTDKGKFFNQSSFTKHAGTEKLQKLIEAGASEVAIKETWHQDLEKFKKIRKPYLMYP